MQFEIQEILFVNTSRTFSIMYNKFKRPIFLAYNNKMLPKSNYPVNC